MKTTSRFVIVLGSLVLLGVLGGWWERGTPTGGETAPAKGPTAREGYSVERACAATAVARDRAMLPGVGGPVAFAQFNDWSARYLAAARGARRDLLAEGQALATARRGVLAQGGQPVANVRVHNGLTGRAIAAATSRSAALHRSES